MNKNSNAAWGLVSVIVSELVLAPGILGLIVYFGTGFLVQKFSLDRTIQLMATLFAALTGMAIAFYRINQLSKKWDGDHDQPKS